MFGYRTATGGIKRTPAGMTLIECRCVCGHVKFVPLAKLREGKANSCGCVPRSHGRPTHGKSKQVDGRPTRLYIAWCSMIQRCERPRHNSYKYYGARGIAVCARWRNDFAAFASDVGDPPSPFHSIDRIDVNGNYEPGNVRWATSVEQNRNTRRNRRVVVGGESFLLRELCEQHGISMGTVMQRIDILKWPLDRALTEPARLYRRYQQEG